MKFKIKHEKSNLLFMSSVILLCLVTCIFWLMLREYIYFVIYFVLTLVIAHVYYMTNYYLKNEYLVCQLGFIKIKVKYKNIKKIENYKSGIKIMLKNFSITIYPNNRDIFNAELKSKMKGK